VVQISEFFADVVTPSLIDVRC